MFIRAYLRASTAEQDASRARALSMRCGRAGLVDSARYVENESEAKLHRPELFRLLAGCEPGDVLLVEQVDRLSRPTSADWIKLRAEIDTKHVWIEALDLPTSWNLAAPADEFTGRMFAAVNNTILDCSPRLPAKTKTIVVAVRPKVLLAPKPSGCTRAGRRTKPATPPLPLCWAAAVRGARSWTEPDAAARCLRRSLVSCGRAKWTRRTTRYLSRNSSAMTSM